MLVFTSISLKMCLALGAAPGTTLGACIALQTTRSAAHKNVGGATSASAFSLGHHRENLKKVENP